MIKVQLRKGMYGPLYRGSVSSDNKLIATFSVGIEEFDKFKALFHPDVVFEEVE